MRDPARVRSTSLGLRISATGEDTRRERCDLRAHPWAGQCQDDSHDEQAGQMGEGEVLDLSRCLKDRYQKPGQRSDGDNGQRNRDGEHQRFLRRRGEVGEIDHVGCCELHGG